MSRPARSHSPSIRPSGDAATPAAHSTVRAAMRWSPSCTPAPSTPVTSVPVRTSTPSPSSCRRAFSERSGGYGGSTRSVPSTRITRAERGWMRRNSPRSVWRAISVKRTRQLDPGGTAADHDEGQPLALEGLVLVPLRVLESQQHAAPHFHRVLHRLQPRGVASPVVVPEVRMAGSGGDHREVVGELAAGDRHLLVPQVEAGDLGEDDGRVALAPEDVADRSRDVRRRQSRRRHLVEQRLEHVVVAAVHQGDAHRRPGQRARRGEAPEAPAHDHDVRQRLGRHQLTSKTHVGSPAHWHCGSRTTIGPGGPIVCSAPS